MRLLRTGLGGVLGDRGRIAVAACQLHPGLSQQVLQAIQRVLMGYAVKRFQVATGNLPIAAFQQGSSGKGINGLRESLQTGGYHSQLEMNEL